MGQAHEEIGDCELSCDHCTGVRAEALAAEGMMGSGHVKRARRRSKKRKKPHQGELFYTGPPAQRRFASGKKVGRPREEGSCQRHEERPTRNPRNPLHVTLAADAHADDA